MKRCFVALDLPDPTREALATVCEELAALRGRGARRTRPVRPENMHVTLKFLGPTPESILGPLCDELRALAAGERSFEADLVGLGAFPNAGRPRIVYAPVATGRDAVSALARTVEQACEPHGFEPEQRERVPHVTVARIEQAQRRGPLTDIVEKHRDEATSFGPMVTERLVLYESELRPTGAVYTALETFVLLPA